MKKRGKGKGKKPYTNQVFLDAVNTARLRIRQREISAMLFGGALGGGMSGTLRPHESK